MRVKTGIISFVFGIAAVVTAVSGNTFAQGGETEPVSNSSIVGVELPANAQRVLPEHVPAEVDQTLEKVLGASSVKLRRGETEVIVWAGGSYSKADAPKLVKQLEAKFKAAGWMFEIGGEQDGSAIFSLLKEGSPRRAVIGFYGAENDAFVLALTEVYKADGGK